MADKSFHEIRKGEYLNPRDNSVYDYKCNQSSIENQNNTTHNIAFSSLN